jgi:dipeptidyl aminopeptidase/acylaminoacyl peptidase
MLKLAGMRIDPVARSPFEVSFERGLLFRATDSQQTFRVPLGDKPRLDEVRWSHHSDAFAFTLVTDHGTELWLATIHDPTRPTKLTDRLSTVLTSFQFHPDGKHLICTLVPQDQTAEPLSPCRPSGPNIQESSGVTSPTRTYQDLLATPHDELLFDYYGTSQLAEIDFDGEVTPLGEPAMVFAVEVSANGENFLVSTLRRPFSYMLPYPSFPRKIEVWDRKGKLLHLVAELPMADNVPIEGVPLGPRRVQWTSSDPATLHWFEALDGGDPRREVPYRDRLIEFAAPFIGEPRELLKIQHRAMRVSYLADPDQFAVTDYDRDRRWIRTELFHRARLSSGPQVLIDRNLRDAYGDPGSIVSILNEHGHAIARQDGLWIYFSGDGSSPEGDLPFLDRYHLMSGAKERLWRCDQGCYENPALLTSSSQSAKPSMITRHQSPASPPNYFVRDLQAGHSIPLTDFVDPTPQIRKIQKTLVKYQRADGVSLSATLYLPANYQEGTRLPLFVWAYPMEFTDASVAGQITTSPWAFTRITGLSHLSLLTQGYAIMDNATMPVVGSPEKMNDTFVEQIVASAKAAIDFAAGMGVADPSRVAIGGHSYGAFMTANLLAHCDFFRAGVARSGAYNRTLTPFGFQSERRPFWEAVEVYMNLSPFRHAHRIKSPLLLIHGEEDNNPGTFPLQSQRLFQAIKGNGGTVRLVMLPLEGHGYRARESILHTHAETIAWLNKYVKGNDD